MMPGTTVRPFRSTIRTPGPGTGAPVPTATKRPFLIDTIVAMVLLRSIVWILPLTKTSSSVVPAAPVGACPVAPGAAVPVAVRLAQPRAAATAAEAPAPSSWRRDKDFRRPMLMPFAFADMVIYYLRSAT